MTWRYKEKKSELLKQIPSAIEAPLLFAARGICCRLRCSIAARRPIQRRVAGGRRSVPDVQPPMVERGQPHLDIFHVYSVRGNANFPNIRPNAASRALTFFSSQIRFVMITYPFWNPACCRLARLRLKSSRQLCHDSESPG